MNFGRKIFCLTIAITIVGLLGLNAVVNGEMVWDEDSQCYIKVTPTEYAPPVYNNQVDQVELLWDDIHDSDGDDLYGNYSTLAGLMVQWGLNPTQISTGSITYSLLQGYEILVVIDEEIAYSNLEIADIQQWIAEGGKLFVIGENSGAFNMASHNTLLQPYNMQFYAQSTSNANGFSNHPVVNGLNFISWAAGSAQTADPPAYGHSWTSSGYRVITTWVDSETEGVVIIVNDSGLMNNSAINSDDNMLCMENTFKWLADIYNQVDFTVTLTADLPVQIPAEGGSFEFDLEIANDGALSTLVDGWIDMIDPSSAIIDLERNRIRWQLGPSESITWLGLTQDIDAAAAAGIYQYYCHVGEYPATVWNEDYFEFEKLTTDIGSHQVKGFNLYGFTEENAIVSHKFSEHPDKPKLNKPKLSAAGPNPFNPETSLRFNLPFEGDVSLKVYNIMGREVANLLEGHFLPGEYNLKFNAVHLSSGIYFAQLQVGNNIATVKLLLAK